ncbi:MAG: YfhO family protein [Oscillospiraceae bacterium]|nr:YfhO family protein [Oscillospiraceae bacterium]
MYKQEKKYYQKAFLVALAMAAIMFLPLVIIDGGYFIFYGDYNAQQIPFFKMCVRAVHEGLSAWDWHTDLGANFVGSYSYYTLGSPFFWFMCLFPASISEYLMAPLLCVKIALFSLFAFMYIRRFVTKPQTALIGGILYAFSSFNLYNIFFQFQDAIIWFPLLLIGLEEAVINKRHAVFALTVAINCLANYFFFIGECVFLVIYFLVRYGMDKRFVLNLKGFLCLAFESIVGVMIAGVLFIPSIYQVLDVPRSTNMLTDWDFLFYGNEQRYGLILESMFFPPEVAARNAMFSNANAKWSSVALYLPLFGMAGVIAFVKGAKGHWARVLLPICLLFAMVPGLNASFTMFNNNFYTRWFYMPELICCLATVYTLEHEELDLKLGMRVCAVCVAVMGSLAVLAPFSKRITNSEGNEETILVLRLMTDMSPAVWVMLFMATAFLVILWLVIRMRKKVLADVFLKKVTAVTIFCSMILGFYFLDYGRIIGPKVGRFNKMVDAEFNIDDPDFYRIEGVDETNNVNMFWNMSSLKSFTSIVPGSTFDLYELIRPMKDNGARSVNSAPETNRYAFRAFARVKYIMIPQDMSDSRRNTVLDDLAIYEYMNTQGFYDVYKTDYALPMGFAYDSYFLRSEAKGNKKVDNLMVRCAVLTDEQAEKYSDILTHDNDSAWDISLEQFKIDAQKRIDSGVKQFSINKKGFTAMSDYDSEKLVVFSVPWCKGWSATVNGTPAEIDKINGGLCGIRVPEGICEISFEYETPGLKYGVIATIIGILLLAAYFVFFVIIRRERGFSYVHLYDQDQVDGVKAHKSYIGTLTRQIYDCPERDEKSDDVVIKFPEREESFMNTERCDFNSIRPGEISKDGEADRVMKELDSGKNDGQ